MKLKKYNNGGGFVYTPFLPNISGEAATTTTKEKASTKTKDDGLDLDKALLDVIKTNGIPIDYTIFVNKVGELFQTFAHQEMLTGREVSPIAQLSAMYSLANQVSENKKSYDTAVTTLQNNQAWAELATDTTGNLYVLSEDGIDTVTPTEYHENSEKYRPLTNGQMMHYRSQVAGLAFDRGVLMDMSNATSMKQINDYLRDVIKEFGTTTMTGYTVKQHRSIQAGLEDLLQGGPDGVYKFTSEYQLKNDKDVQAALAYLYDVLPQNMKNLIVAKTAAENGDPNSTDVYSILAMALQRHTKSKLTADYDSGASEDAAGGGGGGKSDRDVQSTYLENIMVGKNYTRNIFSLSPEQAEVQLKASGYNIGRIVDAQQNSVAANNVRKLSEISQTLLAGNLSSVSFGNQLIESEDLNALVWNGTSDVIFVDLPTKTVNGRIVPDFSAALALSEIYESIENGTLTTTADIQRKIDTRIGANRAYFDPKTKTIKFDPRQQSRFITFSAYASDNHIDGLDENQLLAKLTRQDGKRIQDWYNRLVQWGGLAEGKDESVFHQGDANKRGFYQGNVFILMGDPILGQAFTNPQYHPISDYKDVANKMNMRTTQTTQGTFRTNF